MFDTFSPVIQWIIIRLMLVLSLVFNLETVQVDYKAAFLHAPLPEEIYVAMSRGYGIPGKVLILKKSLYGLRQSPRNFFENLRDKLIKNVF